MVDLSQRSSTIEIMDDFDCHGEVVHQTLRELHAINTYLGGNKITLDALHRLTRENPQSSYSFADLGCGGGDMMIQLAQWAYKRELSLSLTGFDANAHIVDYAEENCRNYSNISLKTQDIFEKSFSDRRFDFIHGSLFFHHFTGSEIIGLLKKLYQQTNIAIIINDLHRHHIAYYFTKYLITRWSKSKMVKYDSVVSVARSFTKKELQEYLEAAGIQNYSLRWKWAFRWELIIRK